MPKPDLLEDVKRELKSEWRKSLLPMRRRMAALGVVYRLLVKRLHHFVEINNTLAERYLAEGNYTDAVLRFRLVLWRRPRSAEAWAGLGVCLLKNGQPEKARAALQKALRLAPGNVRAAEALAALKP